ncbi:MAG: WD40 repeat domain-containing protein [Cyanobacteriota bacterium]|nr:WD40 repeat domain-containing protein [Cyanobacteriota bacterium]
MSSIRVIPPSFKLKKSITAVFSPTGGYLAQIGRRVFVWDVAQCTIVSDFKVISNEIYLAFSGDQKIIAVKNTSGKLAFVDVPSGKIIASSDKSKTYTEGGQPQFLIKESLLLDGDWDGVLRLVDPMSARDVGSFAFTGQYKVSAIATSLQRARYVVAVNNKYNQPGGSRLLLYEEPLRLDQPDTILPQDESQKNDGGWLRIETLAMHPSGGKVAVALSAPPYGSTTVQLIDLDGNSSLTIVLPSYRHHVRSLSWSTSGIVAVSVHENLYRKGQTPEETRELMRNTPHSHVCFYSDSSGDLIVQWPWVDARTVAFSPNDDALVVTSREQPGMYMVKAELQRIGLTLGEAGR